MKVWVLLLALIASPAAAADLGLGFGYFSMPIAGLGLVGHLPLRSNLHFEMALYRGTYDGRNLLDKRTDDSVRLNRFLAKGELDSIGLQYFLGESFFSSVAIARRIISFDLKASSLFDSVNEKLRAESNVFRFALGNTWVFGNGLYITGEWAALSVPVTSTVSTEITTQGGVGEAIDTLEADALDQTEAVARKTSFGITAQIGWQF